MEKWLLFAFLVTGMLFLQSCDEEVIPAFQIGTPVIETSDYSGSPVTLLYSLNQGATFSSAIPTDLKTGDILLVKVTDGSQDLTKEDFIFDWSGSIPKPSSSTADLATFAIAEEDVSINLKLEDLLILVASHKTTGTIYSVTPSSGVRIELFTPTYNGNMLNEIRAFLYHPKENLYYASVSSMIDNAPAGFLYTIDPQTKTATRINENNGANSHEVWDEVSNWIVAPDDSLLSVGDFNAEGVGLVKFGTNGGRGNTTTELVVCCGLGLAWGADNTEVIIANGTDTGNGEVQLDTYTLNGMLKAKQTIKNFENFPSDLSNDVLQLKSLAKDKNSSLYGLLVDETTGATYFVRILSLAGKVTYINTLGQDINNQYSSLAFIPKHLL
jgi:hypothetical protein